MDESKYNKIATVRNCTDGDAIATVHISNIEHSGWVVHFSNDNEESFEYFKTFTRYTHMLDAIKKHFAGVANLEIDRKWS